MSESIREKRLGRIKYFLLFGVAAYVSLKIFSALHFYWLAPSSADLLGDLRDRYREFHYFARGLDPKTQDPLLGYPAWSYLMAGIWAWPKTFNASKYLFLFIQALAACLVFLDLKCRFGIRLSELIVISFAVAPLHLVLDLIGWGNYGIIQASAFYFSMLGFSSFLRGLGLLASILKPQTGLAAWVAALARGDWKVVGFSSVAVFIVIVAASRVMGESSVGSFFATMNGGFGRKLDHFYSTGNYGFLSNIVQAGVVPPGVAVALLYALLLISIILIFKKVEPIEARYVFAAAIFPLFSYHRTHDLVLIWPALIIIALTSMRLSGWKGWLWAPLICWSLTFRENQPVPASLLVIWVCFWWKCLPAGALPDRNA